MWKLSAMSQSASSARCCLDVACELRVESEIVPCAIEVLDSSVLDSQRSSFKVPAMQPCIVGFLTQRSLSFCFLCLISMRFPGRLMANPSGPQDLQN